jgi:hypothetical protein
MVFAVQASIKSGLLMTWQPKDSPEQHTSQRGSKCAAAEKRIGIFWFRGKGKGSEVYMSLDHWPTRRLGN